MREYKSADSETPWYIVEASKLTLRKNTSPAVDHSIWQITFEYAKEGERVRRTAQYLAESLPDLVPREKRYASGSYGIVKPLFLKEEIPPSPPGMPRLPDQLALKSFLKKKTKSYPYSSNGAEKDELKEVAKLMSALGVPSHSLIRTKRGGEKTSALIMQWLEGPSLAKCINERFFKKENLPEILMAISKLLAEIDFIHQINQRGIFDLKPDNIMVVFDPLGKLQAFKLIDLDGSIGHHITYTPGWVSEEDKLDLEYYITVNKTSKSKILPYPTIDFRILAVLLGVLLKNISKKLPPQADLLLHLLDTAGTIQVGTGIPLSSPRSIATTGKEILDQWVDLLQAKEGGNNAELIAQLKAAYQGAQEACQSRASSLGMRLEEEIKADYPIESPRSSAGYFPASPETHSASASDAFRPALLMLIQEHGTEKEEALQANPSRLSVFCCCNHRRRTLKKQQNACSELLTLLENAHWESPFAQYSEENKGYLATLAADQEFCSKLVALCKIHQHSLPLVVQAHLEDPSALIEDLIEYCRPSYIPPQPSHWQG